MADEVEKIEVKAAEAKIEKKMKKIGWPDVFQEGVLIDLDIAFWSGRKKLHLPELGVQTKTKEDEQRFIELFSLGSKRLVPKKRVDDFSYIAGRARFLLDQLSLKFPIGTNRFVPKSTLPKLIALLEDLKAKNADLVEKFVTDYETLYNEMMDLYQEHATAIYQKHKAELPDATLQEFLQRYLPPIENAYPSKSKVKDLFSFGWEFFSIAPPVLPGTVQKHQQKIDGFLDSVVMSLREEITQYCSHVAKMISDGGRFTERTMKTLRNKVARFRMLNFLGDQVSNDELAKLEKDYLGEHAQSFIQSSDQMDRLKSALQSVAANVSSAGPVDHPRFGSLGMRKFSKAEPEPVAENKS